MSPAWRLSSEPTGWDGDLWGRKGGIFLGESSEPTGWDGDYGRECPSDCWVGRSEPTGWDGDFGASLLSEERQAVPSPPCGMETRFNNIHQLMPFFVLSPPCGMATFSNLHHSPSFIGSEPTVWDGDLTSPTPVSYLPLCGF